MKEVYKGIGYSDTIKIKGGGEVIIILSSSLQLVPTSSACSPTFLSCSAASCFARCFVRPLFAYVLPLFAVIGFHFYSPSGRECPVMSFHFPPLCSSAFLPLSHLYHYM